MWLYREQKRKVAVVKDMNVRAGNRLGENINKELEIQGMNNKGIKLIELCT